MPCLESLSKKQPQFLWMIEHIVFSHCRSLRESGSTTESDCIPGHIYDSSPVDFTSDMGRRSIFHPSVLKMSHPPRKLSWMANGIGSSLDALFLNTLNHSLLSIGGLCTPLL
uniref:Uncharacterized protein n=1 Tax=Populus trichocarpa TaxID=3694 RepID=A0A2K1X217_POPTR